MEIEYKALHSASCCYYDGDLYVAFYAGERECVKQRVFIYRKKKGKNMSFFKALPMGSGNPVLMSVGKELYCCYSRFTRPMTNNVFELWRTCYTSVEQISGETNKQYVLSTYCCPRCNPYTMDNGVVLLPCYDEEIAKGMIFSIGENILLNRYFLANHDSRVIQPSLFKYDNAFMIFYRNFTRRLSNSPEKAYAFYSKGWYSQAQGTLVFSSPQLTNIPNNNESIVGINDKDGNALTVFNNKPGRQELTLGLIRPSSKGIPESDNLLILNDSEKASYPNCAFNGKNQLVICFTSYEKSINSLSSICIATVSTNYKKVLSRIYITADDVNSV